MAGIGFELRRLFVHNSPAARFKGYSYALLIAAGPLLVSITLLFLLQLIMRLYNVSISQRDLVSALVTRCYVFAMLLSSGLTIAVTRFVSDRLFCKSEYGIRASLIGDLALSCVVTVPGGVILFGRLELPPAVKMAAILLLVELAAVYVLMSYISAVRAYAAVGKAYAYSAVLSLVMAVLCLNAGLTAAGSTILGLCIGYGLCLVRMVMIVLDSFAADSADPLIFRHWFIKMPHLVLCNTFYALALFSHNFVVWIFGADTLRMAGGLHFSPSYDVSCFMAVLTILPASVKFLVQAETSLSESFSAYTEAMSGAGTMSDISEKRQAMIEQIWKQLAGLFQTQAVFTVVAALLGSRVFLPLLSFDSRTIQLFPVMCLGFYLVWMVFIMTTIILYFDLQAEAMKVMLLLWLSTTALTALLIRAGQSYSGIGLLAGAFITTIYTLLRLNRLLRQIDYLIYSPREVIL